MFKILDGREYFYQWDLNQKLIVEDDSINEVHFSNRTDGCSLVVKVDELRQASVPNILLQDYWDIRVYAYCYSGESKYTKVEEKFEVKKRSKPSDYIYTEEENKIWDNKVDIFQGEENSKKILSTNENGKVVTEINVDEILTNKDIPRPKVSDNGKYLGCENGAATWLPVEASGGGEEKWELIHHGTVGEVGVESYLVDTDMEGNPFSLSKFELTYTAHNPTSSFSQKGGGIAINGLMKSSFATNGNKSGNDSYTGLIGSDSTIDTTKGLHILFKYYGEIVDGYLIMRGFSTGYGYNSDDKVVLISGQAGKFQVGKWNDIVSKGQLFNEGVKSFELLYFYNSLKNADVTIKGVRA